MNLKQQLAVLQASMRQIVDGAKAGNRDLTDAEMTDLEAKSNEAQDLKGKIDRSAKADALMARIGGQKHDAEDMHGNPIIHGPDGWGRKAADALRSLVATSPQGAKSLTSGSVSVPSILSGVLMDAKPRTLLELIPVIDPQGAGVKIDDGDEIGFVSRNTGRVGNGFSFMRQIARTSNAGAVPDGADKPTSSYTFDQVDDRFRVYANKTEPLAWRYLDDFSDLIDVLQVQLREDTLAAIETDVLSGDGVDDRFTGILETSGVQTQAFEGDLLATLSAAKYKLLAQERNLTGWAMNPLDLQALEMLRENGSTGAFLFKDRDAIEGFLGAPVVTTLGLPVGQAVAADWTQAELHPLGDDELIFDSTQRTTNNTFLIMFEGRYGFRVKKPFDFVNVALAA
ncbi:phage major capsid protein [Microbacterium esteraromaticum]|uniref:phage major capsid protein n=1 Tax=Microbacterium esteraromaticum TaxID=57043 RepID=UPI0019D37B23|nr:phage major capsid protein [Microbacterium esteraromaticum]MBN7792508.1 phage major capsid protein [Microbacterium esteraromaticum]